jgi:CRP-like cAMP-binding protein
MAGSIRRRESFTSSSPFGHRTLTVPAPARRYVAGVDASRLAAIPLFADLDDDDLASISASAIEVEADEGETLATQGDLGHALFAIESGTVEVTADGKRLATLGPGDVFGEMAVVAAGIRMATVVATSPVRLIAMLKRDVWALEQRSPETAARLRELLVSRRG